VVASHQVRSVAQGTTRPPVADVVRGFGGRIHRRDLLRYVSTHQVATALAAGDLIRAARGIYVLPAMPQEHQVAAACRGVVSHQSAAKLLGLPMVFAPTAVHVTANRGARPAPMKNVVIHRRALTDTELHAGVTSPLRTALDCCGSLPFREALAVADSAARTIPGFIHDLQDAAGQAGPGRARRLAVAAHACPLSANPFESALRGIIIEAGLTGFRPQVWIDTEGGRYRVDLADTARRVVIEADSFEWHGNRSALNEDCRRYDELVRAGWTVLRFSWEQVMFDAEWVARIIRGVCGGAVTRRHATA
jgi:very-short-patch-repair endonuclease